MTILVRPLKSSERRWLADSLVDRWGAVTVARLGELRDASVLPTLIAESDGVTAGFATLEVVADACEVMTIDALIAHAGVGTALLDAAKSHAREQGCRRLWLITTNDNLAALRFYQRRGLRIVAVHIDAEDVARSLKPSIPLVGHHGIAVHDELELELLI